MSIRKTHFKEVEEKKIIYYDITYEDIIIDFIDEKNEILILNVNGL